MMYRIKGLRLRGDPITLDPLDGDIWKVKTLDQSVYIGVNPPMAPVASGREIDPTHLPRRFRPNQKQQRVPDLVGSLAGMHCSQVFRDIIEEFEPAVHGFYPVAYEWENGNIDKTHFAISPHRAIRALHPDLAKPPKPQDPTVRWLKPRNNGVIERVLSKELVGDAHFFSDPQQGDTWFASQDLGDAWASAGLNGFELVPVEAV